VTTAEHLARPVGAPAKTRQIDTPLGPMVAIASGEGVCLLEFAGRQTVQRQVSRVSRILGNAPEPGDNPLLTALEAQLGEYFAGRRQEFDVPLVLAGTSFQKRVWRQLGEIPCGETISYTELARRVGVPGGQRAVGRANGDNRLAIVVPCHRVIRADGQLGGYGAGISRKRRLLALEGAQVGGLFDAANPARNADSP